MDIAKNRKSIDMLSQVATGDRGQKFLRGVDEICEKWPKLILENKDHSISRKFDENTYAKELLRQILFDYWKVINPVIVKDWFDSYLELQNALKTITRVVNRRAENEWKERVLMDDLIFDYKRLSEDENFVEKISSLYGIDKRRMHFHIFNMLEDFNIVPKAMQTWVEAEIRIYESLKKGAGRPPSEAKAALTGDLLKYVFTIHGKTPELPTSTTINKSQNISYDELSDSMKIYTFIMEVLKTVIAGEDNATSIDFIRAEWRKIKWDNSSKLKWTIYIEEEWE